MLKISDDDAKQNIRSYLATSCFTDITQIQDDSSFMSMGVLDSVGFLEMVAFLEHAFEVKIEDDELIPENMDSISNILRFLEKKRKERS